MKNVQIPWKCLFYTKFICVCASKRGGMWTHIIYTYILVHTLTLCMLQMMTDEERTRLGAQQAAMIQMQVCFFSIILNRSVCMFCNYNKILLI